MTLRLNILGVEVAKLALDLGDLFEPSRVTPVDRGAKAISSWWVRRMTS